MITAASTSTGCPYVMEKSASDNLAHVLSELNAGWHHFGSYHRYSSDQVQLGLGHEQFSVHCTIKQSQALNNA